MVPKWPILILGGAILRPFWDLWDPLVSPTGVLILVFYFLPLPLHNISKKIVKIFARVNWMGAKFKKKFKIWVNSSHFWTFGTPLLSLRGPFVGPVRVLILVFYSLLQKRLVYKMWRDQNKGNIRLQWNLAKPNPQIKKIRI